MQLVRLVIAVAAIAMAVAGYMQERVRLGRVRALPAAQAREDYERSRLRDDRVLYGITAVFTVLGVLAAIDLAGFLPWR